MKKKLFALISAMLLCLILLTSCGIASVSFKSATGNGACEEAPVLNHAETLSLKGEVLKCTDPLVSLRYVNEDDLYEYTVYNFVTNQTVFTAASTEPAREDAEVLRYTDYSVQIVKQNGTAWFFVIKNDKKVVSTGDREPEYTYTTTLYDANGTAFASDSAASNSEIDSYTAALDLICFGETVYRISEDGTVSEAFAWSSLRSFPTLERKLGKYYYVVEDNSVTVYDEKCNVTACYELPSYANGSFSILNNGNVLIQYLCSEGANAEDYTIREDGECYTLYSRILNKKNGDVKEAELDFLVKNLYARDEYGNEDFWQNHGLSDSVKNLAAVYFIENRCLDTSESAVSYVKLSDSAKVSGVITDVVEGQNTLPSLTADGRWTVKNRNGQRFLVNGKGKVLGQIDNVSTFTRHYMIADDKLYVYDDLSMIYDYGDNRYELYATMNRGVLLKHKSSGELAIFAKDELKTLISSTDAKNSTRTVFLNSSMLDFVIIKDSTDEENVTYEVYNDMGDLVLTTGLTVKGRVISYTNGVSLLQLVDSDEEELVYIRLSATDKEADE